MAANVDDTKLFADKYFNFLITDYQFEKVPTYNVSYEIIFGYRKENVEIDFTCENDGTSLPSITLKKYNKKADSNGNPSYEYYYLTEIESPGTLRKTWDRRAERYFPSGSQSGYREKGRNDLETWIRENAEIIKRHSKILSGNLDSFPRQLAKHSFFHRVKALFFK